MSRRSRRKKKNPVLPIVGALILVGAILAGYYSLPKGGETQAKTFPIDSYIDDCNSLRGSEYAVSGEILENFDHDPKIGKFIFLTVDTDKEREAPNTVGIIVPAEVDGPNLETKQSYTFIVSVKREGMLEAREYRSN